MSMRSVVASSGIAFALGPALAQSPLSGPEVDSSLQRTLVESTMTGRFVAVEGRPELAAARLLELTPAQSESLQRLADERDHALVMLLVDGIDTVREITDEMTAGRAEEARLLMEDLHAMLDPGLPRDPLMQPLSTILTQDQLSEVKRMIDEYWKAWARTEAGRDLEGDEMRQAQGRLSFRLFQGEVRRAYDASLTRYRQALEGIYSAVEPTPTQREAIRSIVIEHIKSTRLSPTIEQRREAYRAMYEVLDEPARARLFDYLLVQVVRDAS